MKIISNWLRYIKRGYGTEVLNDWFKANEELLQSKYNIKQE